MFLKNDNVNILLTGLNLARVKLHVVTDQNKFTWMLPWELLFHLVLYA